MTPTTLGDIGTIRMGVTLRGRDATRPDPNGSCLMIRIGDLSDDGSLTEGGLLQFEPGEELKPSAFLQPGEVLFPNRGLRTTAYTFDLPETNVIAGAQFFIIRPDRQVVLPSYIAWFLRGETAAQHFHLRRKGTLVQTVQRRDVEELPLPLPPLPVQSKIVALDALGIRERQLATDLAQKRAYYLQRRLLHAASHA